ncbi:MAG: CRTAC1 family protein [Acidobacteriota bacterium]|nr:CRTAC1 family protein [Acidobacteriota bacterium]
MATANLDGKAIPGPFFLVPRRVWLTTGILALALFGGNREAAGQEDGSRAAVQVLPIPDTVLAPEWMEIRGELQIEGKDTLGVFHDFRFSDRVEESGIEFLHRIVDDSGKHWKPVHYDHGNGISAADVDGDGLEDIYFLNQVGANQLWKNLGRGRFRDLTEVAGVGVPDRISVAASFADVDNDGDADLFVTTVRQGNVLFENRGKGRFRDVTGESGLAYTGHSSGSVFFDYDRDGLLDLLVTNVGVYTTEQVGRGGYYVGVDDAFGGHLRPERTEKSLLYRNLGDCRFEEVSGKMGLVDEGWSGDANPIDVNRDGWPDLYVLNMQGNDEYYENVEGRKFVKKSRELFPKTPWGSMGIQVFDFDNDGRMDIFLTDMHSDMSEGIPPLFEKLKSNMQWTPSRLGIPREQSIYGNAFYLNQGQGRFREISDQVGAENYWPWGLSAGDLNADGYIDAFIASSMNYPFRYGVNSVLLNDGGKTFRDSEFILGVEPRRGNRTARPWFELDCDGEDKTHSSCRQRSGRFVVWAALGSRSSVIFDLDGDGDQDIVTNEFNSEPMVLVSDLAEKKPISYLKVKLQGERSNRDGLGARVTLQTGTRSYTRVHDGKSGYLSQSRLPLYFGLGNSNTVDRIEVIWPSGERQVVSGPIPTNQQLEIREPDATSAGSE